jgi:hypothetical protein
MDTFDYKKYIANNPLLKEEKDTEIEAIDDAVEDAIKLLNPSELKEIDLSEAIIAEEKEVLKEAVSSLVIGGLLAAPKLIEWLGKAIKFIGKKLAGKDENKIADWIINFGHTWEKIYIKVLVNAVKLTGFASQVWKNKDGSIDEQKLVLTAKVLFAVILAVAGSMAIKGVLSTNSAIIQALESTFAGVKATEIAGIANKIKSKII